MVASAAPVAIVTVFWLLVGGLLPWLVPKGPNRGVIQTMLILTAVCCWLFWLCAYLAQINPLLGPALTNETILVMQREWQNFTENSMYLKS